MEFDEVSSTEINARATEKFRARIDCMHVLTDSALRSPENKCINPFPNDKFYTLPN